MNIQEILDAVCEREMYKRVATGQNISLAGLIESLKKIKDKEVTIKLKDGRGIMNIASYRGYYSDLALVPNETPISARGPEYTVKSLLERLEMAVGEEFTGYKGGEFKMENHTPIWVSEYGCTSGLAVKGIEEDGERVFILTKQVY